MSTCSHITAVTANNRVLPTTPYGCEECLANGTPWLHLRLCLTCGHVGCCDDSPNRHARKHAEAHAHDEAHHVIQSFQPGENWLYCFLDDGRAEPPKGYATPPADANPSDWRPVVEEAHEL